MKRAALAGRPCYEYLRGAQIVEAEGAAHYDAEQREEQGGPDTGRPLRSLEPGRSAAEAVQRLR
jgi:hypothetical protein